MQWKNKSRRSEGMWNIPWFHAKEIVLTAYSEGYINWNTLNKALQKIATAKNGNWMFVKNQDQNKDTDYGMSTHQQTLL